MSDVEFPGRELVVTDKALWRHIEHLANRFDCDIIQISTETEDHLAAYIFSPRALQGPPSRPNVPSSSSRGMGGDLR